MAFNIINYNSIFDVVDEEIIADTTKSTVSTKSIKIPAPEDLATTVKDSTEFDHVITKSEYDTKKITSTIIPSIDNLILNTNYTLLFKRYTTTETALIPIIADDKLAASEAKIIPAFDAAVAKVKQLRASGKNILSDTSIDNISTVIDNYLNDSTKLRFFIGITLSSGEYYTGGRLYAYRSSFTMSYTTYVSTYNVPIEFTNFQKLIEDIFTATKKTITTYVYTTIVTYKVPLIKFTDITTNSSTLQIIDLKLNTLISNIISKIPEFTISNTANYETESIKNGKSTKITTLTYQYVSPNDIYYPSELSSTYNPNPKITITNSTITNQKFILSTKKYTLKNSDGSIYLVVYYKYDAATITVNSNHYLMVETWNGEPTSPNSKKLNVDVELSNIMPNIGGETNVSLTNLSKGILYISSSNNHLCITSSKKTSLTATNIFHYAYMISKFTHKYSPWIDTNKVSTLVGLSILPSDDSTTTDIISNTVHAIEKFDPKTKTFLSSAQYNVFYYTNFNKSLNYVDTNNINQFILVPIQIKDDSIGVFGNISEISNVYMITGKGLSTIKNGGQIVLPDGTKYVKFGNHAMKAQ